MKTFTYVIKDKDGVHARPAGIIVSEAKKYQSNISISCRGKTADLKRIFGIMGLCIKAGEEVTIKIEGPDEEACQDAILKVFSINL